MVKVHPYLNFPGTAERAFNFYKSVFGVEFITLQRFRDTPEAGKVPESAKEKIMHISMPLGCSNILMATDALEEMGHPLHPGNNFYLSISASSEAEAERYFTGLSRDGQVIIPLGKASWGAYFGMFVDKFGIQWMVIVD